MGIDGSSLSGPTTSSTCEGSKRGWSPWMLTTIASSSSSSASTASAIRSVPDRWRGEVITARPPKAWTARKIRSSSVATAAKVTLFALRTRS